MTWSSASAGGGGVGSGRPGGVRPSGRNGGRAFFKKNHRSLGFVCLFFFFTADRSDGLEHLEFLPAGAVQMIEVLFAICE